MLVNNPVRKTLFLFLFVWCFQMANAQRGFNSGQTQIKCSPIKLLDLVNPGAEFSLEKKF